MAEPKETTFWGHTLPINGLESLFKQVGKKHISTITSNAGNLIVTWAPIVAGSEIYAWKYKILPFLSDSKISVCLQIQNGMYPRIDMNCFHGKINISKDTSGNQLLTLTSSEYSPEVLSKIAHDMKTFLEGLNFRLNSCPWLCIGLISGKRIPKFESLPSGCRFQENNGVYLWCKATITLDSAKTLLKELQDKVFDYEKALAERKPLILLEATTVLETEQYIFVMPEGVSKLLEQQIYPVPALAHATAKRESFVNPTPAAKHEPVVDVFVPIQATVPAPVVAPVPTSATVVDLAVELTPAPSDAPAPATVAPALAVDLAVELTPAPVRTSSQPLSNGLPCFVKGEPAKYFAGPNGFAVIGDKSGPFQVDTLPTVFVDGKWVSVTFHQPLCTSVPCYVNDELCTYFTGTNGFAVIGEKSGPFQVATLPAVLVDGKWVVVTFPQPI